MTEQQQGGSRGTIDRAIERGKTWGMVTATASSLSKNLRRLGEEEYSQGLEIITTEARIEGLRKGPPAGTRVVDLAANIASNILQFFGRLEELGGERAERWAEREQRWAKKLQDRIEELQEQGRIAEIRRLLAASIDDEDLQEEILRRELDIKNVGQAVEMMIRKRLQRVFELLATIDSNIAERKTRNGERYIETALQLRRIVEILVGGTSAEEERLRGLEEEAKVAKEKVEGLEEATSKTKTAYKKVVREGSHMARTAQVDIEQGKEDATEDLADRLRKIAMGNK